MHGPIFANSVFNFLFHLKDRHSKDVNWNGQAVWMYEAIMHLPNISYCVSLIIVTTSRHVFINFFQTEHFSAVKFAMVYCMQAMEECSRADDHEITAFVVSKSYWNINFDQIKTWT